MLNDTDHQIRELGRTLAEAEERGDVAELDALAAEDFRLIGPLGFVLDKQQWLDRYRSGDLVTRSLKWDDVEVRPYGDTTVAIGALTQEAAYQGRPADGRFRVTQIAVRRDGHWVLAGLHFSPIAQPGPARP
jgi:hypothetical protein